MSSRQRAIAFTACLIVIALTSCGGGSKSRWKAVDLAAWAGVGRNITTEGENCVFDYNRDGIPDVFVSNHDQAPWQLFQGLPDGKFAQFGAFPLRDRHGCATADFNGDGRPDIYAAIGACMGQCLAPKELWIQTKAGKFVNRARQYGISAPGGRGRVPLALNANGDGWPDLFTGEEPGVRYPSHNQLWINVGGHRFVKEPGPQNENISAQCAAAGDVKGDGSDVLIVCGLDTFAIYDVEHGKWTDVTTAMGLPTFPRGDAELVDMNGDGKLDLLTVWPQGFEVRLNRGGHFPKIDSSMPMRDAWDMAVGDANGDGHPDVYIVQRENGIVPDVLLLNRGSGVSYTRFSRLPQATTGEGDTAQAIPHYEGTKRAAFLVNNGIQYPERGPRQLIFLVPGSGSPSATGTAGGGENSTTTAPGAAGGTPSAVAACFTAAKVPVSGPQPAGPGTAVYAYTRSRRVASEGFVKAPDTTTAAQLRRKFAAVGNHIKTLKSDPAAFGFYRGTLTSEDSALLSKCVG